MFLLSRKGKYGHSKKKIDFEIITYLYVLILFRREPNQKKHVNDSNSLNF